MTYDFADRARLFTDEALIHAYRIRMDAVQDAESALLGHQTMLAALARVIAERDLMVGSGDIEQCRLCHHAALEPAGLCSQCSKAQS